MNSIFISILFVLCTSFVVAQSPVYPYNTSVAGLPSGSYIQDQNNYLDHYDGTWEYTSGNTSFTLILEKVVAFENQLANFLFYIDELFGKIKYIKDGVTIVNTLGLSDYSEYPVMGIKILESSYVIIGFNDPAHTEDRGYIKLIKTTDPDVIVLKLSHRTGEIQMGGSGPHDFSVPYELTLTRVD